MSDFNITIRPEDDGGVTIFGDGTEIATVYISPHIIWKNHKHPFAFAPARVQLSSASVRDNLVMIATMTVIPVIEIESTNH